MEAQIRTRTYISTAIVYGILILLLFILKLYTEIPPFGGGGGGGGNLGYVELASGNIQPMSEETTTTPNPVEETAKPTPATPEEIMTQENEESAKIEEIPKPKKETEKPVVKKIEPVKTVVPEKVVVKKVPERKPDPNALYPGKSNNSTSQGTANTGKGDQGTPGGNPFGGYGKGDGSGGGNGGGKGDGIGDGTGNGTGPGGGGNGIKVNLTNREIRSRPQVSDNSQETGTVVVDITVDKNGNVVIASPGGQGSTTTSKHLYELSKLKAKEYKFNASPDGSELQKGTITFVYKYKK